MGARALQSRHRYLDLRELARIRIDLVAQLPPVLVQSPIDLDKLPADLDELPLMRAQSPIDLDEQALMPVQAPPLLVDSLVQRVEPPPVLVQLSGDRNELSPVLVELIAKPLVLTVRAVDHPPDPPPASATKSPAKLSRVVSVSTDTTMAPFSPRGRGITSDATADHHEPGREGVRTWRVHGGERLGRNSLIPLHTTGAAHTA